MSSATSGKATPSEVNGGGGPISELVSGSGNTPVLEPSCLDAALDYASRGWAVLPLHNPTASLPCSCGLADCSSPGKHPCTDHGVKDATTDENTIRSWWKEHPTANVGIATGSVSGIAVLDIDPRHDGDDSLALLEREHGRLPDTVVVSTGGGGKHLYFKRPGGRAPNRTNLLPGIDVRGDGGFVVAPPSRHVSGGSYQWT